ncbi:hypothetical protein BH11PLA1_BH11PLA1_15390 [soil metagenome]
MSRLSKPFRTALQFVGVDWSHVKRSLRAWPTFISNYRAFKRQYRASNRDFPLTNLSPYLLDRSAPGGTARGAYFHQDLHVARKVLAAQPRRHLDVGSRVDGFVAHLSLFMPVEVLDVRAIDSAVPNMTFIQADLMLPQPALEACADSVSCLHALEHFGLGRYGDPIDYDGHRKGLVAITRLLAPRGTLYLSTPIGKKQRTEFDGQRVFNVPTLIQMAAPDFDLVSISYVDDAGNLHPDLPPDHPDIPASFNCKYGCGILELRKKPPAA